MTSFVLLFFFSALEPAVVFGAEWTHDSTGSVGSQLRFCSFTTPRHPPGCPPRLFASPWWIWSAPLQRHLWFPSCHLSFSRLEVLSLFPLVSSLYTCEACAHTGGGSSSVSPVCCLPEQAGSRGVQGSPRWGSEMRPLPAHKWTERHWIWYFTSQAASTVLSIRWNNTACPLSSLELDLSWDSLTRVWWLNNELHGGRVLQLTALRSHFLSSTPAI